MPASGDRTDRLYEPHKWKLWRSCSITKTPTGWGTLSIFPFYQPLPVGGVVISPAHLEVGHEFGGQGLNFLRGNESADGETKGRSNRRMGQSCLPARGMCHVLYGLPGGQQHTPRGKKDVTTHQRNIRCKSVAAGAIPPAARLPFRPPSPDLKGV